MDTLVDSVFDKLSATFPSYYLNLINPIDLEQMWICPEMWVVPLHFVQGTHNRRIA